MTVSLSPEAAMTLESNAALSLIRLELDGKGDLPFAAKLKRALAELRGLEVPTLPPNLIAKNSTLDA